MAGVPHGSILGPTLYLIYIKDIVKELSANVRLFSDDTSLYVIVEDSISAVNLLNNNLLKVSSWAGKWLVKFNPVKTEWLLITRYRNKRHHPLLYMNSVEIKAVDSHKHLELTFSNDLTWDVHIASITSIAWKRIGTLRRYKFILDKRSLNKIYITYIRPLLEYANITWDSCSMENKRLLDKIEMEAARITTGATKLCSIQKVYAEKGWDNLHSRRNKHNYVSCIKSLTD